MMNRSVSPDQRKRLRVPALFAGADRGFELAAELADRRLHRPARAVGEAANGRSWHDADSIRHFHENIEIFLTALTATHPVGDLEHPAGAFTTGCALTATLVG